MTGFYYFFCCFLFEDESEEERHHHRDEDSQMKLAVRMKQMALALRASFTHLLKFINVLCCRFKWMQGFYFWCCCFICVRNADHTAGWNQVMQVLCCLKVGLMDSLLLTPNHTNPQCILTPNISLYVPSTHPLFSPTNLLHYPSSTPP